MKKIVITGGHFTPALAIIEKLDRKKWDISWIGTKVAIEGSSALTLESKILPNFGIPFYSITTPKLQRRFFLRNVFNSWKLIPGFIQSFKLLLKLKPDVVLSFGSYISVPVAYTAWFLGIPVVIHEQTAASGLANRLVSKIAKFVAISFNSSTPYFPKEKIYMVGNPVREAIFKVAPKEKTGNPPIIYVTGGSRGSSVINEAVLEVITKLLEFGKVYHQTGAVDFKRIKNVQKTLPQKFKERYEVVANYSPEEVEKIYQKADLIISRAGANTISEISIIGIPTIFIPISWSGSDEQTKNANLLKQRGSAKVISESELSPEVLLHSVGEMVKNLQVYKSNAAKFKNLVPQNATDKLLYLVEKSIK